MDQSGPNLADSTRRIQDGRMGTEKGNNVVINNKDFYIGYQWDKLLSTLPRSRT